MNSFEHHYYKEMRAQQVRERQYQKERRQRFTREEKRRDDLNCCLAIVAIVLVIAVFVAVVFSRENPEPVPPSEPVTLSTSVVEVDHLPLAHVPEVEEAPVEAIATGYAVIDEEIYRDVPLDYELQVALYEVCAESGVDYDLALAVIWRETTFRNVVGDNGNSFGYMQVQPRWHGDRMARLGVTDLMDPFSNFRVGCDYLAELLEKYQLPVALTCYNTGSPGHNQYADDVIGYLEDLRNERL